MNQSFLSRVSGASAILAASLLMGGLPSLANASTPKTDHLPATGWAGDKVTITLLEIVEEALQSSRSLKDAASNSLIRQHGNAITVDVHFEEGAVGSLAKAKIPGVEIVYVSEYYHQATVNVSDPQSILLLAELPTVRLVVPNYAPIRNQAGISLSEAPRAHSVDVLRQRFFRDDRVIDGRTQKVGVLSDSFSTTEGVRDEQTTPAIGQSGVLRGAKNQRSGDLPAEVDILLDLRSPNAGIDEGAGMAELIHDIAPGVAQAFHTAFVSQASFADGIRRLWQEAGCTVVVDDVIYFAEPVFQDGIIGIAAENAVRNGVPYFSAAGNFYDRSIRFSYRDINPNASETANPPLGLDLHRWPNGTAFLPIQVPPGAAFPLAVQWNQPFGSILGSSGAEVDLDVYLFTEPSAQSAVFASSRDRQGTTGTPFGDAIELLTVANPTAAPLTVYLALDHFDGNQSTIPQNPSQPLMIHMFFIGAGPLNTLVNDVGINPAPTIFGHQIGEGVFAVAAVPWWESPRFNPGFGPTNQIDPEDFTSLGGVYTQMFNDTGAYEPRVLSAPSFAAVDGNNTTFFGSFELPRELEGYENVPDNFPNFFGTSAAAPNAAAIAALMKDLDPTLSPRQIGEILTSTAIDVTGNRSKVGLDDVTGPGLIDANRAMEVVAARIGLEPVDTPTPTATPVPTATPAPLARQSFQFLETSEGWQFGSVPTVFLPPLFGQQRDALILTTQDNTNTFGFLESPPFVAGVWEQGADRPLTGTTGPSSLYRATFTVRSDIPTTGTPIVPTLRFRTATSNFERSDVVVATSANPAIISPVVNSPKTFSVYTSLPGGQNRFNAYFDVLNFDPTDAANASIFLDRVVVDVLNSTNLTNRRTERDYFFATNSQGWERAAVPPFSVPEGGQDAGGLRLGPSAGGSSTYFSFWTSPNSFNTVADRNTAVLNEPGRLYRAVFRVASNAAPGRSGELPTFRLRMNDSTFNYSAYTNIESVSNTALLPIAGNPVEYSLFFEGRPELMLEEGASPFIFAFDYLLAPGLGNDPAATVTLQSVRIESYLTPP